MGGKLLARLDLRKISGSRSLCFKYQTVEKRHIKKKGEKGYLSDTGIRGLTS